MRHLWVVAVLAGLAAGQELVANGGFEGEFAALAPPWEANCYGDNTVRFERAAAGHTGAAQKIVCDRFVNGGVQWRAPKLAVTEGQVYTVSFWARGQTNGPLLAAFRQHDTPYTQYLARSVRVGPDWRRYTIIGPAKGTDPDCGLYFHYASEGWVELDDVSALPGEHRPTTAAIGAAPVKGNRVYNGSFALGAAGWAPLRTALTPLPDGGLRVGGTTLEGRPLITTSGQLYSLTATLRRPAGPAPARLELVEYMDNGGDSPVDRARLGRAVTIGPAWQRVEVTGLWDGDFTVGALPRIVCEAGGFDVREVQVEEGEATPFAPSRPLELAAEVPLAERYPEPGQPVAVRVRAAGAVPAALPVTVKVVDLWGRAVGEQQAMLAGGQGTIAVTPPPAGLYRLEVTAADAAPGDVVIGVLPSLAAAPRAADGFFGTHAPPSVDPASLDLAARVSARAGCGWHRLHDFNNWVQWYEVEPKPGERHWFDPEINHLRAAGYELLGTLARTPAWAGRITKPRYVFASPPRDLKEFSAYVRDTVAHYRDRIHTWEIWNEPYGNGFFDGPAEEYAALLKAGYAACKAADPNCTVVGVCAYLGLPEWVDKVLATAGTGSFDVFSYHRYFRPSEVAEQGGPPLVAAEVAKLKERMRAHGGEKPIWMSEGGVACPSSHAWLPPDGYPNTPVVAAATVAKAAVLMRSQGVAKWFYYYAGYPHGGRGGFYTLGNAPYILVDYDGSPKATLLALAAAARFIGQGRYVGQVADGRLRRYRFEHQGRPVSVVWSEGEARPLALAAGETAYDVVGRRLEGAVTADATPVYVVGR